MIYIQVGKRAQNTDNDYYAVVINYKDEEDQGILGMCNNSYYKTIVTTPSM